MKITGIIVVASLIVLASVARAQAPGVDGLVAPIYGIKMPAGYREWTLISVARVGAPVNDMRAKLGNDIAVRAFREGTMPFPDGTIIARLAWNQVTSDENNVAVRSILERSLSPEAVQKLLAESFVAGPPSNVQSWSRIPSSTRRPAAGGSRSSPMARPTARRCTGPVSDATRRPRSATTSSPGTHADRAPTLLTTAATVFDARRAG
jgi:hypothetical protein